MSDYSVLIYMNDDADALDALGFDYNAENDSYTATFWVTDESGIQVTIFDTTKYVTISIVYQDGIADSLQREDVIPYDLDIHDRNDFPEWLDDTIGEMWFMCIDKDDETDFYSSMTYDE